MAQIALRSNKTREEQRPPRWIMRVTADVIARLNIVVLRPTRRSRDEARKAHGKQSQAVTGQPGTTNRPGWKSTNPLDLGPANNGQSDHGHANGLAPGRNGVSSIPFPLRTSYKQDPTRGRANGTEKPCPVEPRPTSPPEKEGPGKETGSFEDLIRPAAQPPLHPGSNDSDSGPPARSSEPPARSSQPPAQTEEPPARRFDPPVRNIRLPGRSSESPAQSPEPPEKPAVQPEPGSEKRNGEFHAPSSAPSIRTGNEFLEQEQNGKNGAVRSNGFGMQISMEVTSRPQVGRPAPNERKDSIGTRSKPGTIQSLKRLYEKHPDLPPQSAVLGVCEDGLPVLLDLLDPSSGALLVLGDEREEQLELMRMALFSVAGRNSPRGVQLLIISHLPDTWRGWIQANGFEKHVLSIEGIEEEPINEWIIRLADWTEQRRLGQRSGPPILLVMDTLAFIPRLPYDIRLNFDWMAKEGPAAQIWPIAVISTDLASTLGTRMLRGFQSRILGFARDPKVYYRLANLAEQDLQCFSEPGAFAVQAGDRLLRFWLPSRSSS